MADSRGKDGRLVKPLPALVAVVLGAGAAVAVAGTGSTELGDTTTTPTYGAFAPVVQFATESGTRSYTTPNGVLTSWRYHSSPDTPAGSVGLVLYRQAGGPGVYETMAKSEAKALEPDTGYEFSERIPVEHGWVLGLDPDLDAEVGITVPSSTGNQMFQFGAAEVTVGQTQTATGPFANFRVNVSATVEPDADADGFGDETQDQCPSDPATQGACDTPETEITKDPANKSKKSKAKYEFRADEPGSTFECSLKGKGLDQAVKQFGACDSPRTYKRLVNGKYRFKVRASDEQGNVDPTPAKDKFKLLG